MRWCVNCCCPQKEPPSEWNNNNCWWGSPQKLNSQPWYFKAIAAIHRHAPTTITSPTGGSLKHECKTARKMSNNSSRTFFTSAKYIIACESLYSRDHRHFYLNRQIFFSLTQPLVRLSYALPASYWSSLSCWSVGLSCVCPRYTHCCHVELYSRLSATLQTFFLADEKKSYMSSWSQQASRRRRQVRGGCCSWPTTTDWVAFGRSALAPRCLQCGISPCVPLLADKM